MTDKIMLNDEQEYYLLLGKNRHDALFLPLNIDMITKLKVGDCIESKFLGTLFENLKMAVCVKDLLLRSRYSKIKIARLQIIKEYSR